MMARRDPIEPGWMTELGQMEEARRQTRRQIDRIERRIRRRTSAAVSLPKPGCRCFDHRGSHQPASFARRTRATIAAITLERQPEIDALSRELARQDRAAALLRVRLECHLAAAA